MKFRMLVSAIVALLVLGCATPTQLLLDAEVDRLCAVDGGMRVYETIKLPPDKFNQWGQVNFYLPTQRENALGQEFLFKEERRWLKTGDSATSEATLLRTYFSVTRKVDNRLLGESVSYGRGGGDIPGPWHPSSYRCPKPGEAGDVALLMKIFVMVERN